MFCRNRGLARSMNTLNSHYTGAVSPSFGEGPTQRLIETLFPGVKKKRQKLESGIAAEGSDAKSLVTTILAHHIDPSAETQKKPAKKVIIVEKPVLTEKPGEINPETVSNDQAAHITQIPLHIPVIANDGKPLEPLKKVAFNGNEGKALNLFA